MKNKQENIKEEVHELRKDFDHQRRKCIHNNQVILELMDKFNSDEKERKESNRLIETLSLEQRAHKMLMEQFKDSMQDLKSEFKSSLSDIREDVKTMADRIVDAITIAKEHKKEIQIWSKVIRAIGMIFLKTAAGIVTLLGVLKMLGYI